MGMAPVVDVEKNNKTPEVGDRVSDTGPAKDRTRGVWPPGDCKRNRDRIAKHRQFSPISFGGYFLKVAAWAFISAPMEACHAFIRCPTAYSSFGSM